MKNLTNDEFAKFMFDQSKKIENYNFDLFHDIARIVNYAYDVNSYKDDNGQIITDKAVYKEYFLHINKYGSHLFEIDDPLNDNPNVVSSTINKYKIKICPNHSYLYKQEFAQISTVSGPEH